MKLKDIAIWWSARDRVRPENIHRPMFKVLEHMADGNENYAYLHSSVGRCFGGWESADPRDQAAHVLCIYHQATAQDGVSPEEAHSELMQIDEYRSWVKREDGPFRDVYWLWSESGHAQIEKSADVAKKCANCRWWNVNEDRNDTEMDPHLWYRECRSKAPTLVPVKPNGTTAHWPDTVGSHSCGEFKERPSDV